MAADVAHGKHASSAVDGAQVDLARLIEDTGRLCADAAARRCGDCPQHLLADCREKLCDCGHRFMELLLHHLAHEQPLLVNLPCTEAAGNHRARHHDHHQEFVTGYNRIVMDLGRGHPAEHIQRLEALVARWTRDHVLVFDAELTALLAAK